MNLKKSIFSLFLAGLLFFAFAEARTIAPTPEFSIESADGYVYIHLENKCGHDVKYQVKYPGHGSSGTINKNSKRRLTVQAGGEIYIDGEHFMDVSDGNDGKTFVVCR